MFETSSQIKIDPDKGCWVWQGWCDPKGYGRITTAGGRSERVHRLVYRLLVGPIAPGMTIDHLCFRTSCCNPAHLEVVTRSENSRRLMFARNGNSQKTHCPQNHPYDDENTYRRPDGSRGCKTCIRKRTQKWYREKKAAALASRQLDR